MSCEKVIVLCRVYNLPLSLQAQPLNALSAPGIQAETPLNDQYELEESHQSMQEQRGFNGVSENTQFPGAVAPAWFGPALEVALAPLQNQLNSMEMRNVARVYNSTVRGAGG